MADRLASSGAFGNVHGQEPGQLRAGRGLVASRHQRCAIPRSPRRVQGGSSQNVRLARSQMSRTLQASSAPPRPEAFNEIRTDSLVVRSARRRRRVGLRVMLRSLEAMAQGTKSPPRFLMTHWPVGTIRVPVPADGHRAQPGQHDAVAHPQAVPAAGRRHEPALRPHIARATRFGGGHEEGTSADHDGARTPGTRRNGGEDDDAVAGGPSWDQIFLNTVPAAEGPGRGLRERDLRHARRLVRDVDAVPVLRVRDAIGDAATSGTGGRSRRTRRSCPTLSPLKLYTNLSRAFMPGGGAGNDGRRRPRLLKARKSVLDYSLRELDRMRTLAPGERGALEDRRAHARDPQDRDTADHADQQRDR